NPTLRRVGQHWQGDPDQTIQTELLQDASVQHRGGTWRRTVAQRGPGVKGPKGDENAEPKEEERENQVLRRGGQRGLTEEFGHCRNIKRIGARLYVEDNQTCQRDQGAEAEIKRDLERGIILLQTAPPDTNHDESWHQCQLVKKVKEKQVQRGKRAQYAPG